MNSSLSYWKRQLKKGGDSEMEYNNHECIEDGSSLHVLTESELNQIIIGEKTEEEIWQEKENFLKKRSYNNPTG